MKLHISKNDMKMIAASGGLIGGGQVVDNASGGSGPGAAAGAVAKSTGMLGLSFIGANETLQAVAKGQQLGAMMYAEKAMNMGREVVSSARRAAPGLKLLAGRIAQGANRVI